MKKILVLLICLIGLVFPWACSDNHSPSNPSGPTLGTGSTPTAFTTPGTFTSTPTLVAGANTFTPTPTFALPAPVYQSNFSTSAAPRGMVISGGFMTVAENELRPTGIVSEKERYNNVGTANLNLYNCGGGPCVGNVVYTGCPPPILTPGITPQAYVANATGLNEIQGYVNPGGDAGAGAWSAVLDLTPGGGASLYCGYINSWNDPGLGVFYDNNYVPFDGVGYSGIPLRNPQAMCADFQGAAGSIYITDTGNGYVDQLSAWEGICPDPALPIHRWNGTAGVSIGGTGVNFSAASVTFRTPTAVACDATGNVWVGDQGYNPSYMMEFTSGATTILESWQTVANCKVSGIAVNTGTGNVYVADSGNNLVEIYSATGTLLSAFGDPGPAAHELHPFAPTCIAFAGGFIYVGDSGNDYIDVFQ